MKNKIINSPENKRLKASNKFIAALAIVSIIGFSGIISETLFNKNVSYYVEAFWMLTIGIGFIIEGQINKIKNIRIEGLTPTNFTHLTTIIIGVITVFAGIFSFPNIRIEALGFLAVKGIISVVAIAVIIVQTWIVK